jgi:hypothetical protein
LPTTIERVLATPRFEASRLDSNTGVSESLRAAFTSAADLTALATKIFYRPISLAGGASLVLDLTALTGGKGDTSFAKVFALHAWNSEAANASKPSLVLGAEGSINEWWDPIGEAAGAKLTIPPSCGRLIYTQETAGYVVGPRKLLKIANPGGVLAAGSFWIVGA